MVQVINDAKPDMLLVSMTAPNQEKWVEANHPTEHPGKRCVSAHQD